MSIITYDLVNKYIEAAELASRSQYERLAIDQARRLNERGTSFRHDFMGTPSKKADDIEQTVKSWRSLILEELRIAFCEPKNPKYRKEVEALKENGNLLIGVVAGYVAACVNASAAVLAALVAATLRLVLSMGVSTFCRFVSK
jgi:hypothetical protein